MTDHEYLSAGDTPYASGDRAYTGCVLCGRTRKEHERDAKEQAARAVVGALKGSRGR